MPLPRPETTPPVTKIYFMIIALLVKKIGVGWIDVLFPPAAMGAIVAIIGLELAPLAMTMSGFLGEPQGMSAATSITISMFTLIVTILATVLGRGFISIIPILIGVIAGYILSVFMGVVDFTHVEEMPWFALPTFYAPHFNLSAIMMILPALFVVLAEHIGHLFVTSDIVGRDLIKDPGLHRSLFADGLSNMISGFVGSTPNTTYGENMGVMAMTGVYSTWVIGGAACFAIVSLISRLIARKAPINSVYTLNVTNGERMISGVALCDTGNSLVESFSGYPVIIGEYDTLLGIMPQSVIDYYENPSACSDASNLRLILCKTVSNVGVLPSFRPKNVEVVSIDRRIKTDEVYIAVTKYRLGGGEFDFIFNPKLFDGVNDHEDNRKHRALCKRPRNASAAALKAGGAGSNGGNIEGERQRSGKADST